VCHAIIEQMKSQRRRSPVPIIYVEWFPGRTKEQKVEVVKAITKAMVEIAKAPADATHVIFKETSPEDWACNGTLWADVHKK